MGHDLIYYLKPAACTNETMQRKHLCQKNLCNSVKGMTKVSQLFTFMATLVDGSLQPPIVNTWFYLPWCFVGLFTVHTLDPESSAGKCVFGLKTLPKGIFTQYGAVKFPQLAFTFEAAILKTVIKSNELCWAWAELHSFRWHSGRPSVRLLPARSETQQQIAVRQWHGDGFTDSAAPARTRKYVVVAQYLKMFQRRQF